MGFTLCAALGACGSASEGSRRPRPVIRDRLHLDIGMQPTRMGGMERPFTG